ncbi:MAG: UvrD-helicase domain-containing protein [Flammeovirgaceae bacterium]|nr:UvrD-helicase domain-containing protein [Flammeovirgaceae bacterium]
MSAKLFHIYKSSAGSGKTRTLAKEYLLLALRFRADYFKHILAVTFTNKATQEMKDRILDYLDDFAKGEENNLTPELLTQLKLDPNTFQMHAQEVQGELLHHYSQFSISTIDAFFQRVIRSFTRETGLMGDFRLEIDHDMVLEEVIDNLIDELKEGTELTNWVIEFAKSNLENERSWDIRRGLKDFSEQIFKETFKEVELAISEKVKNPTFFKETKESLAKLKYGFLKTIQKKAAEAVAIIEENNISANDFSYGASGTPFSFFYAMATLSAVSKYAAGSRLTDYFNDLDKWGAKKSDNQNLVNQLAKERLGAILTEILEYVEINKRKSAFC